MDEDINRSKKEEEKKGGWRKLKEKIKRNIFLQALPYALLISSLTALGLFGGFFIGKGFNGSVSGFLFSLFFSFIGFFSGIAISYIIVKVKYQ